jgi:hypothetical protein
LPLRGAAACPSPLPWGLGIFSAGGRAACLFPWPSGEINGYGAYLPPQRPKTALYGGARANPLLGLFHAAWGAWEPFAGLCGHFGQGGRKGPALGSGGQIAEPAALLGPSVAAERAAGREAAREIDREGH